jgi:hypothetical protein
VSGRPLRIAPPVLAVTALWLAFVAARAASFGGDPSAFVVAGDGVTDVTHAPANLGVHRGIDGYDGQAYYRLGRSPLTDQVSDHGIAFSRPAYWQTRIGYPALVWALSLGGSEALVPTMLVLVNLLAVVVIAVLAARLARDRGHTPWLAVAPALWAGLVIGVAEDLTEPLAAALLLGALVALRTGRWAWAAGLLTAAALTRETSLLVAGAVLAVALLPPLRRVAGSAESGPTPPWWVGAAPIGVYLGWRSWVRARWEGAVADAPGDNILGVPVAGLVRYLRAAAADPAAQAGNLALLGLMLLALTLVVGGLVRRDSGLPHERLALAAYLLLLTCLPVWDRSQAYLRWGGEPVLLGWVVLLGRPTAHLRALAVTVVALWLAAALATYRYPGTSTWQPATTSSHLTTDPEGPCPC